MQHLASRLPDVGTSIFTIMSKMANDHQAINLSQGFPDFAIDEKLIALVTRFMQEGHNQYAPMAGIPVLRQVLANIIGETYSHPVDPETEMTITSGATEGIFAAVSAFIRPGDEVILFDPSYDSYAPSIRLNGGLPVHLPLKFPDFSIDWEQVRDSVTPRTRMIIVNNPHNPSATVLSPEDLLELEKIALENHLLVLSDEVYERLVFDGLKHQSVLSLPGLASRSMAVFSFGKTFHATGWKVGYVVAPASLTTEIRKTHQFIVFSVNHAVQWALSEYLNTPAHYLNLGKFYQAKRDLFLEQIKGSSFEPLPSRGSYFQVVSYKTISHKPDVVMAEDLVRQFRVASIPMSVFYRDKIDNRLLRFCFAKKDDTLARAGEILRKI